MRKHDFGKWHKQIDIFYDRFEIRDEDGRRIAVCTHDYPMSVKKHDKNANLIEAAPDLLRILEDILDSGEIPYCNTHPLVVEAKEIINKVYGEK